MKHISAFHLKGSEGEKGSPGKKGQKGDEAEVRSINFYSSFRNKYSQVFYTITAQKVFVFGVSLVHIFPHSGWMQTRKTSNTVTFYEVKSCYLKILKILQKISMAKSSFSEVARCWIAALLTGNSEHSHCVKSVEIRSFFWSVFSCIRTEHRKVRSRKNSVFRHFSCSVQPSGLIIYL